MYATEHRIGDATAVPASALSNTRVTGTGGVINKEVGQECLCMLSLAFMNDLGERKDGICKT